MIKSIVAVSENNVIGKDNQLPWHISRDLKRFKKLTMGHPMIMGRKTFESLGKPLPGRIHFVISSNPRENTEQVKWVSSLNEALGMAKKLDAEISIIGGGTIFEQSMDLADVLEITRIHRDFEGDVFFPEIPGNFECVSDEKIWENDLDFAYSFRTYVRKTNDSD